MAYLQITTRCNMKCAHCCMSATSKGQDMSIETFRNALKWDSDESVSIGGGEPTIHPFFWQILGESIAHYDSIWLATNGKVTPIALSLAKMAQKGIISCALSQDSYHEPIESVVVEAFRKEKKLWQGDSNDYREIRNVDDNLIRTGRCRDGKRGCCCPGLIVKPNGDVKACGCKKSPIMGNVNTEVLIPYGWDTMECYQRQEDYLKEDEDSVKILGGKIEKVEEIA